MVRLSSDPRGAFGLGGEVIALRPPVDDVAASGAAVRASVGAVSIDGAGPTERIVRIAAGEKDGTETEDAMTTMVPHEA